MPQEVTAAPAPVSVALGDSNPLMLSALSGIFVHDTRFSLVTTAATAEGFLATVMRVPAAVGVIDWQLPQLGGLKLVEVLRDQPNAPRLVIYGDDARGTMAQQPLTAGAAGVVPRSAPPESLLDTCLAVAEGKMVFPFLDIRRLQADPMQQLTRRERSLLESLSKVLTNRELAEEFGVSPNTVKFHLSNLYERIGAKNRASAIALLYTTRHSGRG